MVKERFTTWQVSKSPDPLLFKETVQASFESQIIINKSKHVTGHDRFSVKRRHLISFKGSIGKRNFVDFTSEHTEYIPDKVIAVLKDPRASEFRFLIKVEDLLRVSEIIDIRDSQAKGFHFVALENQHIIFVIARRI